MVEQANITNEPSEEIWDWTKLNAYACMLRGHYTMEQCLVPKEPREAIVFGQAMHKMAETWTKCAQNPDSIPDMEENVKGAFLAIWEKELPFELREKLELEGNRRSYANARRLFAAYICKFPLEMFDKIVAAEQPFSLYLGDTPNGKSIRWSGILDRIVQWQGGTYYVDIKTSSYPLDDKFFDKFRYNGQMLGYVWAGEQMGYGNFKGIMIHGIEVKVPQEGLRFKKDGTLYARQGKQAKELVASDIITIYPNAIEEWKQKTLWKIDRIYEARAAGYWEPDMGNVCMEFGGCNFHKICASPSNLREIRIQENYKIKPWNPHNRDNE